MRYTAKFTIITEWVPELLHDWLVEGLPVDLNVKAVRRRGARMLEVSIEAGTAADLEAKRRAFNAMIEAKGYGPGATKK